LSTDGEKAPPIIPGNGVGALCLGGDGGDGLEPGEAVERDPFGEREEEVAAAADLHGQGRATPEPRLLPLERVGPIPPDLTTVGAGRGGVDAQGAVGAAEETFGIGRRYEELPGVRGDGLDAALYSGRQLDGVIRAVHHGRRARSGVGPPRWWGDAAAVWDGESCRGQRRERRDSEMRDRTVIEHLGSIRYVRDTDTYAWVGRLNHTCTPGASSPEIASLPSLGSDQATLGHRKSKTEDTGSLGIKGLK
jgi:hypothetical protein